MLKFSKQSQSRLINLTDRGIVRSLGYPVIFHWGILFVLIGLIIFSTVRQMIPLLVSSTFLLILVVVPRLWGYYVLKGISVLININQDHLFPDEELVLHLGVRNRGLPLHWLQIELEMPYRLVNGRNPYSPYTVVTKRWITSVSSGRTVGWRYMLQVKARGDYQIGPLRLRSSDLFGLFPRELILPCDVNVLVYPKIMPLSDVNFIMKAVLGEEAAPRNIYEDVSRIAGTRDYRPEDPFKFIHWKATAAHAKLLTKLHESGTELNIMLVLNVEGYEQYEDEFEHAVSVAASLACQFEEKGYAFGLLSNGEPRSEILTGGGQRHLMHILEQLARVTTKSVIGFYELLDRYRLNLNPGTTTVIITRNISTSFAGLVQQFERHGYPVRVIETAITERYTSMEQRRFS